MQVLCIAMAVAYTLKLAVKCRNRMGHCHLQNVGIEINKNGKILTPGQQK